MMGINVHISLVQSTAKIFLSGAFLCDIDVTYGNLFKEKYEDIRKKSRERRGCTPFNFGWVCAMYVLKP